MDNLFFDFPLFPASNELPASKFCSGENQKNILIVLKWESAIDELKPFLSKVLTAVKLDIEKDVLIVDKTPENNIGFNALLKAYTFRHILIFGILPQELGLHFKLSTYEALSHRGQLYLLADGIEDIYKERQSGGKQKAGALWNSLKSIFVNQ